MTAASPNPIPTPTPSQGLLDAAADGRLAGVRLLNRIGNTPLLPLDMLTGDFPAVQLFGKAEWYNPGGSIKDRTAASIVTEARRAGKLSAGKTLLDSTSGNTGIAYSMLGSALGFPVTLCVPENISPERKRILQAYGANIIFTDSGEGSDGATRVAHELAEKHPEKYFYADQYSNNANWRAHYTTTANEIWRQTEGRITHFVAIMGTTGTFVGTTRRLKELNPNIRCISLQPDSPFHGIEGTKHLGSTMVPGIYDATLADEQIEIRTEDAHVMARRLAREAGMLVGVSAAAGIVGSLKVAQTLKETQPAVIVTVLGDSGEKYLSEKFWNEGSGD